MPLLVAAVVVVSSGSSILLALLPGLTRGLELSETTGSLVIAVAAVAYGLGAPLWGRRSERAGRVPTLSTGLLGYGFLTALFAAAMVAGFGGLLTGLPLIVLLIATRAVGGLFGGAVPSTAQAYLVDVSDESERAAAVALMGIAGGLGLLVGPAVGGAMGALNLTAPLWVSAVVALTLAALVRRRLPEPSRERSVTGPSATLLWRDPRPRLALGLVFATFVANAIVVTTVGFLVQDRLDLTDEAAALRTGAVLFALGAGLIAVQVAVVRRLDLTPRALVAIGLPVGAAGIALQIPAQALAVFLASGFIVGSGLGMAVSGATAAATLAVGRDDQGALGGFTVLVQTAGFALGPPFGAALYENDAWLPLAVAIGVTLLTGAVAALALPPRTSTADPPGSPS